LTEKAVFDVKAVVGLRAELAQANKVAEELLAKIDEVGTRTLAPIDILTHFNIMIHTRSFA
jgi:hypothetical protein